MTTAIPSTTASAVTTTSGHCSGKTAGRPAPPNVLRARRRHMAETLGVAQTFGIVLFAVVAVAVLIAVLTLATSDRSWDQIGRGGLSLREDESGEDAARTAAREREDDRPAADPALEAEIRSLVIARNERRARQGREPLDVDAEVARRLRDLTGGDGA